eukprot:GHRR01037026.1.p1 GENE.GHRR01037026.1~~GHRR01037026.1.p1  ORF type:complete len:115 (-),score=19.05 GHRR01037026.1:571-915(-)
MPSHRLLVATTGRKGMHVVQLKSYNLFRLAGVRQCQILNDDSQGLCIPNQFARHALLHAKDYCMGCWACGSLQFHLDCIAIISSSAGYHSKPLGCVNWQLWKQAVAAGGWFALA